MANFHMGYMGSANIGGTPYFMSGSSLNPVQTVEAPDLVGGHEMKRGWNYGKVEVGGNITAPFHENATSLWDYAFQRTADGDHMFNNAITVAVAFYSGGGWTMSNCVLGSLAITATAGEVVNFTAEFVGRSAPSTASGTAVTCARLVTWDRVKFTSGGGGTNFQSITFTLNNNVQKAYAISGAFSDLYPVDLPCGFREITGSLSTYAEHDISDRTYYLGGADKFTDYSASPSILSHLMIDTGSGGGGVLLDCQFKAQFHRPEGSGTTGLAMYTLNFTGVCDTV